MTPQDPLATYFDAYANGRPLPDSDFHQLLLDHLADIDLRIVRLGQRPDHDIDLLITLRQLVAWLRAYFHSLGNQQPKDP